MKTDHNELHTVSYIILGDGRLSRHLQCYLSLLKIPFAVWSRAQSPQNLEHISFNKYTIALLAISDGAIASFSSSLRQLAPHLTQVHFSGALTVADVEGWHPLMTFSSDLYDLETYQSISFVGEKGRMPFDTLFPKLSNKNYQISSELKSFYHALCVMAGNFPQILWSKIENDFSRKLNLPKETLQPYLKAAVENFFKSGAKALSGPLVRGDFVTIEKNLNALKNDSFLEVYESFVRAWSAQAGSAKQPSDRDLEIREEQNENI
jgi:predicted short-subunit dehydrogenase-like oxidoreductase (DUF2520 family)